LKHRCPTRLATSPVREEEGGESLIKDLKRDGRRRKKGKSLRLACPGMSMRSLLHVHLPARTASLRQMVRATLQRHPSLLSWEVVGPILQQLMQAQAVPFAAATASGQP
jgi:hypothetical protein